MSKQTKTPIVARSTRKNNLHDWILLHDAKHVGTQLYAVKSMWQLNKLEGKYYLANDDTDDVLPELMWALLPSAGWSIASIGAK